MVKLLLLPLLLLAVALLRAAPATAARGGGQDGLPQNMLQLSGLHEVSMDGLERTLDVLADLLEERTLPSGEKGFVSRLVAPTLHADSAPCRRHTEIFWEQLLAGAKALWPYLMFDASGKLPDGILAGNLNAFGSIDECFLVSVSLDSDTYSDLAENELKFTGRYVPVTVSPVPAASGGDDATNLGWKQDEDEGLGAMIIAPTLGLPTGTIGLCVPSSCSSRDVQDGLQTLLGGNVTVTAYTSEVAGQAVDLRPADIIVITIMALVGVLMVIGTAMDLRYRRFVKQEAEKLKTTSVADSHNPGLEEMLYVDEPKPAKMRQRQPPKLGTWQRVFVAFSLYTNTKKLLYTTATKGALTCVHGIRFFSMTWVVLGHATSAIVAYDQNLLVVLDWFKGPWFQPIANGYLSVDTFFLLSGVLLAYGFCSAYEKKGKFNILTFYVHRFLRLTPPLAIMIAITATIFVYFGDGPLWAQTVEPKQIKCQDYWWRNLLYIQNLFPFREECLGPTWYLASDMQMFLFSPLVLLPLVWKPLFGVLWLCLLTVGFLALRVAIWSTKNLPPISFTLNKPDPEVRQELTTQYVYPWIRCTVWLTGIGLGYLLHRLRGRQVTLKPWLWLTGWIAAFAIGVSVVYGMTGYQMPWQEFSKAVAVTYGGLHRFAWGVAVAWVIFDCVTGYGGPINTFLSYPGFIPLSRLSYAGYLIHGNVIMFMEASVKGTVYVDAYRLVYRVLTIIIVTFAAALPLSLAFEAPFINLEKIMFGSSMPTRSLGSESVPTAEAEREELEWAQEQDHEVGSPAKESS